MKVLLDNNVPAPLRRQLTGHLVRTAYQLGWHTLENGDLIAAAERDGFEVLVTADKNLFYQQNLSGRALALVILSTNDWPTLRENTESVRDAVQRATPGSFCEVRF